MYMTVWKEILLFVHINISRYQTCWCVLVHLFITFILLICVCQQCFKWQLYLHALLLKWTWHKGVPTRLWNHKVHNKACAQHSTSTCCLINTWWCSPVATCWSWCMLTCIWVCTVLRIHGQLTYSIWSRLQPRSLSWNASWGHCRKGIPGTLPLCPCVWKCPPDCPWSPQGSESELMGPLPVCWGMLAVVRHRVHQIIFGCHLAISPFSYRSCRHHIVNFHVPIRLVLLQHLICLLSSYLYDCCSMGYIYCFSIPYVSISTDIGWMTDQWVNPTSNSHTNSHWRSDGPDEGFRHCQLQRF